MNYRHLTLPLLQRTQKLRERHQSNQMTELRQEMANTAKRHPYT